MATIKAPKGLVTHSRYPATLEKVSDPQKGKFGEFLLLQWRLEYDDSEAVTYINLPVRRNEQHLVALNIESDFDTEDLVGKVADLVFKQDPERGWTVDEVLPHQA